MHTSRPRRRTWTPAVRRATTHRILNSLQRTLTSPEPLDALSALTTLRTELDALEREQVRRALESGYSYSAVARELGISRQAAHRRYRSLRTVDALRDAVRRARFEAARRGSTTVELADLVQAGVPESTARRLLERVGSNGRGADRPVAL
jgi:transposase-like protein